MKFWIVTWHNWVPKSECLGDFIISDYEMGDTKFFLFAYTDACYCVGYKKYMIFLAAFL